MKSGKIEQFAHLSQFTSVKDFNQSMKRALELHGHHFTKGELLALLLLTRFSAKYYGVCNARICKLVQASQSEKGGVSRSTFERMLRKAKSFGILTIHNTIREKGGLSHSVYVFNRFDHHPASDRVTSQQLTDRTAAKKRDTPTPEPHSNSPETSLLKTTHFKKDLRPNTTELDYSFVPAYVPQSFVQTSKPFFNTASEICTLWSRVMIAYRAMKFECTIDTLLPTITKAFKHSIYRYKQSRIKTSFIQYFYGTLAAMFAVVKRKVTAQKQPLPSWL
ncbi:hypothetical protein [Halalkalibacter urbisdiaboli]|uniref:hypothetical protein n=1 Tax=Halalkalibacter urbisdiaboli TaxID=1960589 RepID=UPI000B44EEAD|nr:hypothetical protein [Halalkalibacter urbisdiaboli]